MAISINKVIEWWKNSGQTFHAVDISITDTASATDSKAIAVTVDNTEVFHVDKYGIVRIPSFTVAGVPSAATAGRLIYVSNEAGGATLAFSDGTNWRRTSDRAIVS